MNTDSYWLSTAALPRFKKLGRDHKVDVVVVGAGITGITAAYLLKKAGKRVALLERDRCVCEDTAATTAHLTCVMDIRLPTLVKNFGQDHARAAWDAGLNAVDLIESIAQETESPCNFRRVPGYLHGSLHKKIDEECDELKKEASLAAELGFDVAYVENIPIFRRPAMRIANQAKFHPALYLRSLLEAIDGNGSFICESSEVEEFSDDPLSVKANGRTVTCDHIIIATHVPLMGNNGLLSATLFQTKLSQYSSYAIGARMDGGDLPEAVFWDTSDPYYYTRIDSHRSFQYIILGGEDHKTGQLQDTAAIYKKLEHLLHLYLPQAKIDRHWSGQIVDTNDGLPFIGQLGPHQFVATGFSGNGITFGTHAAQMACDWVMDRKNPWTDLFEVHRKKILGGTWNYMKENLDYPYYLIKDRITRADHSAVQSVKKGEGKILLKDGKRVAVSRDENGKLSVISATCTHLGCVVHWNNAEKTWDCPCHGSRFKCTGQVMTGPAETALKHVKSADDQ